MLLHRKPLDEPRPVELPRAVPATTRRPLPLGAPARSVAALAELRAETSPAAFFNAIDARPIPHANWDAWLADDFDHVNARLDNLSDAIGRECARTCHGYEYSLNMLTAPLLSAFTDLTTIQLPKLRKARAALLAELALYDAKAEVA